MLLSLPDRLVVDMPICRRKAVSHGDSERMCCRSAKRSSVAMLEVEHHSPHALAEE